MTWFRQLLRHIHEPRVLGINGRNLNWIYTHNRRSFFPNVDDKLRCKELLASGGVPSPRTYHVIEDPSSLRGWPNAVAKTTGFVIKPNQGYGGNGIMLVDVEDGRFVTSGEVVSRRDIDFHLLQICNGCYSLDNATDRAFLEERISNDTALDQLIPSGVAGIADIRLIYRGDQPVMGMLRLPTHESGGRANLHQGGIGLGIDLKTGMTRNGCHGNEIVTNHPESGVILAGHRIPYFDKMQEYGQRVSELVGLGYVGIDFVVDRERGPLVLEVNARPGLNIQIANQQGLLEVLR